MLPMLLVAVLAVAQTALGDTAPPPPIVGLIDATHLGLPRVAGVEVGPDRGVELRGFPGSVPPQSQVLIAGASRSDTVVSATPEGSFHLRFRTAPPTELEIRVRISGGQVSSPARYDLQAPRIHRGGGLDVPGRRLDGVGWYDICVVSADTASLKAARVRSYKESQSWHDSLILGVTGEEVEDLRVYGRVEVGSLFTAIVVPTGRSFSTEVSHDGHFEVVIPAAALDETEYRFMLNVTDGNRLAASMGVGLLPQRWFIETALGEREQEEFRRGLLNSQSPSVELLTFDGEPGILGPVPGQPTLLVTWASWCAPCRPELLDLKELAPETDLAILTVSVDKDFRAALSAVERWEIPFPVYSDTLYTMRGAFGAFAIPHTVLIDRDGIVVWAKTGTATRDTLEAALQLVSR